MKNFEKALKQLKSLNLPSSEFVVIGGGCLAIHNLRDTNDVDILVTKELWNDLIFKYPITEEESIIFGNVEILGRKHFAWNPNGFSDVADIINKSKKIDGINYAQLDFVKLAKLKTNRTKDLIDVELIDEFLGLHTVL
jgi:hypothetical protein